MVDTEIAVASNGIFVTFVRILMTFGGIFVHLTLPGKIETTMLGVKSTPFYVEQHVGRVIQFIGSRITPIIREFRDEINCQIMIEIRNSNYDREGASYEVGGRDNSGVG